MGQHLFLTQEVYDRAKAIVDEGGVKKPQKSREKAKETGCTGQWSRGWTNLPRVHGG
jgi:hypothetical protein